MNQHATEFLSRKPINGFPLIAHQIASDEDKTTTIYRRFDQLSARNLSYLEAEIAELEALQNNDWRKFELYANEKDQDGKPAKPAQARKMALAMKIKEKFKEYHEALAVHQILLNSPVPAQTTVQAMRSWFLDLHGPGKIQPRPQLWGASIRKYDDINDLVALRVPADQDRLSEFILHNFGVFFQSPGQEGEGSSAYVSERAVARFVAILSSVLSAVLLFGSITSLYFVHNPYALLGMLNGTLCGV